MNVHARLIGGPMDGQAVEIDSEADFWRVAQPSPIFFDDAAEFSTARYHTYKIRSHGHGYYDAIWVRPKDAARIC